MWGWAASRYSEYAGPSTASNDTEPTVPAKPGLQSSSDNSSPVTTDSTAVDTIANSMTIQAIAITRTVVVPRMKTVDSTWRRRMRVANSAPMSVEMNASTTATIPGSGSSPMLARPWIMSTPLMTAATQ